MLRPFEPTTALTLLGLRTQIHPNDVVAFEGDLPDLSPIVRGTGVAPRLGAVVRGESWISAYDTRGLYTDGRLTTPPSAPDGVAMSYQPGYPKRPEPVDVKTVVATLQSSVSTAQQAADAAQARADNARQMVLNRDPKLTELEQITTTLTALGQSYAAALPASVADRASLHQRDTELTSQLAAHDTTLSSLAANVAAEHTKNATQDGQISTLTQQNAIQDADFAATRTALQAKDAAHDTAIAAEHAKNDAQDTTIGTLTSQMTAVMSVVASHTASITALQARAVVSTGNAPLPGSLLGGATADVVVTISPTQPDTNYNPVALLGGGGTLLSSAVAQGVVSKTTTTVTVRVKNTLVTTLVTTGGMVYVVATR